MSEMQKDLVLSINEYAYVLDETKGHVVCWVGPSKTSLSNSDKLVRFDTKSKSKKLVNVSYPYFIKTQGNFGNLYTGDGASAPRYIECRLKPLAKRVLHNPAITQYVPSYDGRNKEPVVFPAKLPVVLVTGAEGIAVGMSTNILSHNLKEVIQAEIACLKGEEFHLYPDCPTGGLIDVSDYQDGLGKIVTRAKLDTKDPKRIVIRELPFGSNSERLTESIVRAAKNGKIKATAVTDFTAEKVEIEIRLQRGVYAEDVVQTLYAFTDCEQSISCNLLVIKDNMPQVMTVSDVVRHHSQQLVGILKRELELAMVINPEQAAAAEMTAGQGVLYMLLQLSPILIMVLVMYFLMIRPERKRRKKEKAMLDALKRGDRICTIGGIYGTIMDIKDDTITLSVGNDNVKLVFARWAIRNVEEITVEKDGVSVRAVQLMKLMGLGVKNGDTVTVAVEGGNEEAAFAAMKEFFDANL